MKVFTFSLFIFILFFLGIAILVPKTVSAQCSDARIQCGIIFDACASNLELPCGGSNCSDYPSTECVLGGGCNPSAQLIEFKACSIRSNNACGVTSPDPCAPSSMCTTVLDGCEGAAPTNDECPYGGTCKTGCSESEQGNGMCAITTANYCCVPINSFTCYTTDIGIAPNPKTADPGDKIFYTATFSLYGNGNVGSYLFSSTNTSKATVPVGPYTHPAGTKDLSTTVSALSGTGANPRIKFQVFNTGGELKCEKSVPLTVTTTFDCTLTLTPATPTVKIGDIQALTASVTNVVGGPVRDVTFSVNNTKVSITPLVDNVSPFRTTATAGLDDGTTTVTAEATLDDDITKCSDTAVITIPTPTCTLNSFSPVADPINVGLGVTRDIVPNITITNNGTVNRLTYSSSNTINASVTSPNSINPYKTTITGNSEGGALVTANVYLNNVPGISCTNTKGVNVVPVDAWWQVVGGDVTTNENIVSLVPTGQNFIQDGGGGFPGVPIYGTSLSAGTISSKLWNANTKTSQGRLFDYSYFNGLVPDDITFTTATNASLNSSGFTKYGYEWYRATTDLNITSLKDFADRKVILFVEGGSLNINRNITLNDGSGFFAVFVDGDINIDPFVTQLEGIYLTNVSFKTGGGNKQLNVRGSVASFGGVTLERELANNSNPSEIFEYGPDQVMLFPEKLDFRRTKWIEVAP